MRTSVCACAVIALIGLMADLALGHGGTFTGPAGRGTPTFGGPAGGSSGGTSGGTTGSGGTGGRSTGGGLGRGGGSTPPGGGGPGRPGVGAGNGGSGGGATPAKKGKDDDRIYEWDFWWELNDDQFLQIK